MVAKRKGKHTHSKSRLLLLFVFQPNTSVKAHKTVEYYSTAAAVAAAIAAAAKAKEKALNKKIAAKKNEQKKMGELRYVCVPKL